jgi:hypothetical protein
MALSNTSLIPEFQHYFREFVLGSEINKNQIPLPTDIKELFLKKGPPGSVVELLCLEDYAYDTFNYLYREEVITSWPELTRQRLMIYPSSKYMIHDATGVNFFNLQQDDLVMLNILLAYRQDSTSVQIFDSDTTSDSTALVISVDTTSGLIIIDGDVYGLSTPLSKLIFLYLDLHINGNYLGYYLLPDIISDCSMLATCFELKLIDDYFDFMTDRGASFNIQCPTDEEI